MRKTSQDGGDSSSIASGFDNEIRKTSVGIIKTKRTSIKRKVQNFSLESDETVIEPLLQIDKSEAINPSAKYLISNSKTESINECEGIDILSDSKSKAINVSKSNGNTGTIVTNSSISRTLHNHMNTNVFGVNGSNIKRPVLVEINGGTPVMHSNQTSSIFTTAKISADSMTKNMEPIHVTPVPILSTVEVNATKSGISSECQQSKSILLSSSNDILQVADNPGNNNKKPNIQKHCFSDFSQKINNITDLSKPSTSGCFSKSGNILESKLTKKETLNEPDSNTLTKTYDIKKSNVKIATVDSVTTGKTKPQSQSPVNLKIDKKYQAVQSQQQNAEVKSLTEVEGKFQKQNISTVQTITPKEVSVPKEGKCTTGSIKQLQRQKNYVLEDPRDTDVCPNKNKIDVKIQQFTSSSYVQTGKSNLKEVQSTVSNSVGTFIENPSGNVQKSVGKKSKLSSDYTHESFLKCTSPGQQSISMVKTDSPVSLSEATNKDIVSKPTIIQDSQAQSSVDLATSNQISKADIITSHSNVITGIDSRYTGSLKQPQLTAPLKSELVKDSNKLPEITNQVNKIVKDPIQVLSTELPTSTTDSFSKKINSSSTTGITPSKISCGFTNQSASVRAKSCTIKEVKPKCATDKAISLGTVLPADSTLTAKTVISKPSTLPSRNAESAVVVSKFAHCSSDGKSMSISQNTPKTTASMSDTTSSHTVSQKLVTKDSLSEKDSKNK